MADSPNLSSANQGVTVTARTVYDWRCDECGRRESHNEEGTARAEAREHREFHAASRLIGRTLEGKVLDTDRTTEMPWFGIITKADEYAREHGFAFLVWNGNVHTVGSQDLSKPVCYARDVPGTRAAERVA